MGLFDFVKSKKSEMIYVNFLFLNSELPDTESRKIVNSVSPTPNVMLVCVHPNYANQKKLDETIQLYAGGAMVSFAKHENFKYDVRDLSSKRFEHKQSNVSGWIFTWPMKK